MQWARKQAECSQVCSTCQASMMLQALTNAGDVEHELVVGWSHPIAPDQEVVGDPQEAVAQGGQQHAQHAHQALLAPCA